MYFVAIKWAAGKAVRPGLAVGGHASKSIRNRRATQPPAHFIATLRAGASWLFFRVALSTRMIQIWVFVRALKNSQLTSGKVHVISGTGHELILQARIFFVTLDFHLCAG